MNRRLRDGGSSGSEDFVLINLKEQKKNAQAILNARALYFDSSLTDLYDELTMPVELRRAHQANDKAVMEAYDMTKIVDGKKTWLTESETVARLFEMYGEITKNRPNLGLFFV